MPTREPYKTVYVLLHTYVTLCACVLPHKTPTEHPPILITPCLNFSATTIQYNCHYDEMQVDSSHSDNSEIGYISTQNSHRQSLKTTQLNMIESFVVHPAATSSIRGRLQRNAVVLILTLAFICAVFLSTHRILASAPTSSSTDEHHKLKVWSLNSSHSEAYKLEYAPTACIRQLKNILIICP